MSSTTPSLSHNKIRARPSASGLQSSADSPRTPLSRSVSGLYGSPGSSFRIDDENLLIFEFGSRNLRAGFAGESAPRCRISYSPELWRRSGDYRHWDVDFENRSGREGYELWGSLDVRHLDLGVVEDRVEKLIREAEARFLLLDNRAKRISLTAPSSLPRPLLSILLRRLFEGLQAVSVTVFPCSVMSCVGAGVRSAIVLEIGWLESTATAVCEYREVRQLRSIRAGRALAKDVRRLLRREARKQGASAKYKPHFEEVDDVLCRAAWCRASSKATEDEEQETTTITIPITSKNAGISQVSLPLQALAEPAETALFGSASQTRDLDDHDLPLSRLLYEVLRHLPIDIRSLCTMHIIVTGGISNIPGIKQRIISDLQDLVKTQSWDPIREYAPRLGLSRPTARAAPLSEVDGNLQRQSISSMPPTKVTETVSAESSSDEPAVSIIPAHLRPHDANPIDSKLASLTLKDAIPTPAKGTLRAVNTLGAWAGASLATNLRIRGVVELERDRFLSHGLVGGAVPGSVKPGVSNAAVETSYARTRQSLGANAKLGEKSGGWGLGVWA
ncbi:uncharacterized protein PV09_06116 [Verruconis gallopava]|uniref:Actin-like ATPase domain-containing protein n=1 Tax=Verruconis gallopava TaxID=253628 RepID=A0A0D2AU62_9PEZI|nr:uncharacterized protein PV09_06116 [Verruconis gallopava]KIW02679.1 hypothetical protein PV09_06116 [Verruconis gallopava]